MVPRLRQRVCLETLRRELQLVDVSAPSPSPSLAVKDSWKGTFRVEIDDNCDFATTDSQVVSVGDKIPGFRTSAGMHKALNPAEAVVTCNVSILYISSNQSSLGRIASAFANVDTTEYESERLFNRPTLSVTKRSR
ncbi:hypothetical protein KCU66_g11676, partial [Aureobasidium melanogenum]